MSKWQGRRLAAASWGLLVVALWAAEAGATSGAEVETAGGIAAAIACGLFLGALGPVAGIIAGVISSCGWLLFDAIFL